MAFYSTVQKLWNDRYMYWHYCGMKKKFAFSPQAVQAHSRFSAPGLQTKKQHFFGVKSTDSLPSRNQRGLQAALCVFLGSTHLCSTVLVAARAICRYCRLAVRFAAPPVRALPSFPCHSSVARLSEMSDNVWYLKSLSEIKFLCPTSEISPPFVRHLWVAEFLVFECVNITNCMIME